MASYPQACLAECPAPSSPIDDFIQRISIAIGNNAEAIDRLACRTASVRLHTPCPPTSDANKAVGQPSMSDMEERLCDILTRLNRNTDNLINITDEIRL